jgi:hypothetical protein
MASEVPPRARSKAVEEVLDLVATASVAHPDWAVMVDLELHRQ